MEAEAEIAVRDCNTLDDYRQCVEVQQTVWGWEDRELIPLRFFVVAHKIEGQVIGAFEPGGRMVGFSLAVPALKGKTVYLHSHMLGVLANYRERGVGRRLKLEQRRKALKSGIKLIEWTFDPLELKNAYFNIERLGAIARRYVPNQYGTSSSPLHRGLPTDRLVAEWWLDSPRVIARTKNAHRRDCDILSRIAVPTSVADAAKKPKVPVARIQKELRQQFQDAFSAGLAAVGFELTENVGSYLLGRFPAAKRP